jgi:hypothetical protein
LTRERDLLQRQKTNISLVSDNLQLVQVQLEAADHTQKIVLQVTKTLNLNLKYLPTLSWIQSYNFGIYN